MDKKQKKLTNNDETNLENCDACKKCEHALENKKEDALHYCLECEEQKKLEKKFKQIIK